VAARNAAAPVHATILGRNRDSEIALCSVALAIRIAMFTFLAGGWARVCTWTSAWSNRQQLSGNRRFAPQVVVIFVHTLPYGRAKLPNAQTLLIPEPIIRA